MCILMFGCKEPQEANSGVTLFPVEVGGGEYWKDKGWIGRDPSLRASNPDHGTELYKLRNKAHPIPNYPQVPPYLNWGLDLSLRPWNIGILKKRILISQQSVFSY